MTFLPASAFLRCKDKGCTLHNINAWAPHFDTHFGASRDTRIKDQFSFNLGEGRCDGEAAPFFPTSFVRVQLNAIEQEFCLVSQALGGTSASPCTLCDAEFGLLLAHFAWINSPNAEAPALAQRLARASHGFYAPADAVMPSRCVLPASRAEVPGVEGHLTGESAGMVGGAGPGAIFTSGEGQARTMPPSSPRGNLIPLSLDNVVVNPLNGRFNPTL